jgi:hypothetical protein
MRTPGWWSTQSIQIAICAGVQADSPIANTTAATIFFMTSPFTVLSKRGKVRTAERADDQVRKPTGRTIVGGQPLKSQGLEHADVDAVVRRATKDNSSVGERSVGSVVIDAIPVVGVVLEVCDLDHVIAQEEPDEHDGREPGNQDVAVPHGRSDVLRQQVETAELEPGGGQRAVVEVAAARPAGTRTLEAVSLLDLLAHDQAEANLEPHVAIETPWRRATSRLSRSLVGVST